MDIMRLIDVEKQIGFKFEDENLYVGEEVNEIIEAILDLTQS